MGGVGCDLGSAWARVAACTPAGDCSLHAQIPSAVALTDTVRVGREALRELDSRHDNVLLAAPWALAGADYATPRTLAHPLCARGAVAVTPALGTALLVDGLLRAARARGAPLPGSPPLSGAARRSPSAGMRLQSPPRPVRDVVAVHAAITPSERGRLSAAGAAGGLRDPLLVPSTAAAAVHWAAAARPWRPAPGGGSPERGSHSCSRSTSLQQDSPCPAESSGPSAQSASRQSPGIGRGRRRRASPVRSDSASPPGGIILARQVERSPSPLPRAPPDLSSTGGQLPAQLSPAAAHCGGELPSPFSPLVLAVPGTRGPSPPELPRRRPASSRLSTPGGFSTPPSSRRHNRWPGGCAAAAPLAAVVLCIDVGNRFTSAAVVRLCATATQQHPARLQSVEVLAQRGVRQGAASVAERFAAAAGLQPTEADQAIRDLCGPQTLAQGAAVGERASPALLDEAAQPLARDVGDLVRALLCLCSAAERPKHLLLVGGGGRLPAVRRAAVAASRAAGSAAALREEQADYDCAATLGAAVLAAPGAPAVAEARGGARAAHALWAVLTAPHSPWDAGLAGAATTLAAEQQQQPQQGGRGDVVFFNSLSDISSPENTPASGPTIHALPCAIPIFNGGATVSPVGSAQWLPPPGVCGYILERLRPPGETTVGAEPPPAASPAAEGVSPLSIVQDVAVRLTADGVLLTGDPRELREGALRQAVSFERSQRRRAGDVDARRNALEEQLLRVSDAFGDAAGEELGRLHPRGAQALALAEALVDSPRKAAQQPGRVAALRELLRILADTVCPASSPGSPTAPALACSLRSLSSRRSAGPSPASRRSGVGREAHAASLCAVIFDSDSPVACRSARSSDGEPRRDVYSPPPALVPASEPPGRRVPAQRRRTARSQPWAAPPQIQPRPIRRGLAPPPAPLLSRSQSAGRCSASGTPPAPQPRRSLFRRTPSPGVPPPQGRRSSSLVRSSPRLSRSGSPGDLHAAAGALSAMQRPSRLPGSAPPPAACTVATAPQPCPRSPGGTARRRASAPHRGAACTAPPAHGAPPRRQAAARSVSLPTTVLRGAQSAHLPLRVALHGCTRGPPRTQVRTARRSSLLSTRPTAVSGALLPLLDAQRSTQLPAAARRSQTVNVPPPPQLRRASGATARKPS
eukprot:TRINITY_DN7730_c0_g1_i4.p1 TRINITY_DN7730_c0_g1~~TRINITY_DN7730_c0_g1_i4.p1  ORF type:complete len:1153 (+),score=126.77 TRINITY_DN7730_c0_g1_i4:77-3535(+)